MDSEQLIEYETYMKQLLKNYNTSLTTKTPNSNKYAKELVKTGLILSVKFTQQYMNNTRPLQRSPRDQQ